MRQDLTRCAILFVIALSGCGRDAASVWKNQADLVAKFPFAKRTGGVARIEFGTEAARRHLTSGWSPDLRDKKGPLVRSTKRSSTLTFEVVEPRTLPVRLRCRPTSGPSPTTSMTVELNGRVITRVALEARWNNYRTVLPEAALRRGSNLLTFWYEGEPGSSSPAPVSWRSLTFKDVTHALGKPIAQEELGLLHLPFGTSVDYYLVLPPNSELRFQTIDFRGGSSPQMVVLVETDERIETRIQLDRPSRESTHPLNGDQWLLARLSLQARAERYSGPAEGVFLRAPSLWAPVATVVNRQNSSPRPDIFVYLVDTLRADRLGCYGYARDVSPRLDAFAQSATLFENAIGQCSWTRPSVASIFTSQWPGSHGVVNKRSGLTLEAATLAESLKSAGYETAAFVTNPNVAAAFGFSQGFDKYQLSQANSAGVNKRVFNWLENRQDERPLFLYVHTVDPHAPYLPPEDARDLWAPQARELWEAIRQAPKREVWENSLQVIDELEALYDAEVFANDRSFGELLDYLDESDRLDRSVVAFLSDHGEEFYDHGGWSHGRGLYAETLDFPLVIKLPHQRLGIRVDTPAQHIDLMPTLLDYLGLPLPPAVEGRSLLSHWQESGKTRIAPTPQAVFSHLQLNGPLVLGTVVGEWKLIDRRTGRNPHVRLYNRSQDPQEKHKARLDLPITTAVLRALLDEQLSRTDHSLGAEDADIDPELEASLKALGYL